MSVDQKAKDQLAKFLGDIGLASNVAAAEANNLIIMAKHGRQIGGVTKIAFCKAEHLADLIEETRPFIIMIEKFLKLLHDRTPLRHAVWVYERFGQGGHEQELLYQGIQALVDGEMETPELQQQWIAKAFIQVLSEYHQDCDLSGVVRQLLELPVATFYAFESVLYFIAEFGYQGNLAQASETCQFDFLNWWFELEGEDSELVFRQLKQIVGFGWHQLVEDWDDFDQFLIDHNLTKLTFVIEVLSREFLAYRDSENYDSLLAQLQPA